VRPHGSHLSPEDGVIRPSLTSLVYSDKPIFAWSHIIVCKDDYPTKIHLV